MTGLGLSILEGQSYAKEVAKPHAGSQLSPASSPSEHPLAILARHSAHNMPGIQFDFVTIGHPGEIKSRQHKRMVHQHVMKEIGLSRRKKKKVTGYNEPVKAVEQETRPQEADGSTGLRLAIAKVDQQRTEAVTVSPGLDVALHLPPKMRAQRMNDFRGCLPVFHLEVKTILRFTSANPS